MNFLEVLTLIFVTLKLVGVITWSWWWVLSPIWLPVVSVVALFCLFGVIVLLLDWWEYR